MLRIYKGILVCIIAFFISTINVCYAEFLKFPEVDIQGMVDYACQKVKVLALSRRNFDNTKAKAGDKFSAKLVEDVVLNNKVIIPSGCVVNGQVKKVYHPRKYPCRDGKIVLLIQEIQLKNGNTIPVEKDMVLGEVLSPYAKTMVEQAMDKAPITATYQAISIPLSVATDVSASLTFGIATGAAAAVGAISGYIKPDKDKTKKETAKYRAIGATPYGIVRYFINKGKKAKIKSGEGLYISFDVGYLKKFKMYKNYDAVAEK